MLTERIAKIQKMINCAINPPQPPIVYAMLNTIDQRTSDNSKFSKQMKQLIISFFFKLSIFQCKNEYIFQ